MSTRHVITCILLIALITACNSSKNTTPPIESGGSGQIVGEMRVQAELLPAFGKERFQEPVGLQHAGDGSGRLFVIEKPGIISVLSNNTDSPKRETFLDIRHKVESSGWEHGLLGLAFHPEYKRNGSFYTNYTTENSTVIAHYQTDPDNPNKADAASERILLEFEQPYPNHNGGELVFGGDGLLYIGTGDGGAAGDPHNNAQDLTNLMGKILRIDVDHQEGDRPYAIPVDNPFIDEGEGVREEIYAYGLRNPWRFSFDPLTGLLYTADVGQNRNEEINLIEKGKNYGWRIMEGDECYEPTNCSQDGLAPPIWTYQPLEDGRASITGGFVYRGELIPELQGRYVFADFMDGRFWALHYNDGQVAVDLLPIEMPNVTTFGMDEQGEIYVCLFDGDIMRLHPSRAE